MKKTIIISIIVALLVVGLIIGYYKINLMAVSKDTTSIIINIKSGSTGTSIAAVLSDNKLIRNEFVFKLYLKLHKTNIQAGTYSFNKSLSVKEITKKLANGDIYEDVTWITLVEGKTLKKYVASYESVLGFDSTSTLNILKDKSYLNSLIDEYWFLTDEILDSDIYYPLEGYLFPDTYKIKKTSTIKEVIEKQLDTLNNKLTPYKKKIENSNLSVHEILTLASIVELEANTAEERKMVAQVFLNRIKANMNLGSDVTTYYAEQVEMGSVSDLYNAQYNELNAYNTRNLSFKGLPVGPICNPSLSSIDAVINPTANEYLYFFANSSGKILYAKTYSDHISNQN